MQYLTDPSGFLTTTGELAYSETDDSIMSAFIISLTSLSISFFRAYGMGYAFTLKGMSSVSSILHSARLVFPGMSVKTSLYYSSNCLTSLCWSSFRFVLILTSFHVCVALSGQYLISSLLSSQVSVSSREWLSAIPPVAISRCLHPQRITIPLSIVFLTRYSGAYWRETSCVVHPN